MRQGTKSGIVIALVVSLVALGAFILFIPSLSYYSLYYSLNPGLEKGSTVTYVLNGTEYVIPSLSTQSISAEINITYNGENFTVHTVCYAYDSSGNSSVSRFHKVTVLTKESPLIALVLSTYHQGNEAFSFVYNNGTYILHAGTTESQVSSPFLGEAYCLSSTLPGFPLHSVLLNNGMAETYKLQSTVSLDPVSTEVKVTSSTESEVALLYRGALEEALPKSNQHALVTFTLKLYSSNIRPVEDWGGLVYSTAVPMLRYSILFFVVAAAIWVYWRYLR
ncbi:hypothetical protein [Sulfuracidifex tepidarius]|uniref:Uncharacterized protein n=1 Tax=Sulfuracidifex tepidarius TaxID=1294262 RepID=A0A510E1Z0_9CREN|nr:hypothetical protein [Sulfuracidifex tepidarius]BBG26477.1 hypothetical protein IC007_0987 [Sulfuracidifex tepidarius]